MWRKGWWSLASIEWFSGDPTPGLDRSATLYLTLVAMRTQNKTSCRRRSSWWAMQVSVALSWTSDVARHQEVKYEKDESKVARAINSYLFHDLGELSVEVFELKKYKKKNKCELPIQFGFFVFTYAKLRMLEFYYHCIDTYLDRRDFQYLQMDTDFAYMSLAGGSLEELVKTENNHQPLVVSLPLHPNERRL